MQFERCHTVPVMRFCSAKRFRTLLEDAMKHSRICTDSQPIEKVIAVELVSGKESFYYRVREAPRQPYNLNATTHRICYRAELIKVVELLYPKVENVRCPNST